MNFVVPLKNNPNKIALILVKLDYEYYDIKTDSAIIECTPTLGIKVKIIIRIYDYNPQILENRIQITFSYQSTSY